MANASVDQKNATKTEADEAKGKYTGRERSNTWRKQPSVLKSSRYKIGDGEEDLVD